MRGRPRDAADLGSEAEVEGFARDVVLQRLTSQQRSRHDLEQALAKRHVPAEVAGAVLDRLEEVGLINDVDFARSWVQSRQRSRGLSSTVLAMELRRQGIADDISREVLDELDPEVEVQAAHRLVQKKLRSMGALDQTTQTRRLVAMLARKGYAPQAALEVVRSELAAQAEPLDSL